MTPRPWSIKKVGCDLWIVGADGSWVAGIYSTRDIAQPWDKLPSPEDALENANAIIEQIQVRA